MCPRQRGVFVSGVSLERGSTVIILQNNSPHMDQVREPPTRASLMKMIAGVRESIERRIRSTRRASVSGRRQ